MGRAMTRNEIIGAAIATVEEIRAEFVPNPNTRYKPGGSTGNMAFNALRYRIEGNEFIAYIDESIAPYVWFTQLPWTAARWNGKKNPNEGWFEIFQDEFTHRLARKLGGKLEE